MNTEAEKQVNTEHTQTSNTTENAENAQTGKANCRAHHCGADGHRRCGKRIWMVGALLVAGLLGGLIGRGCTHERGFGHGRAEMGMQMREQGMGSFGKHEGMFGARMVERLAEKVDASDEQKQKLTAIANKMSEGQAERQTQMQGLRQQSMALLSAEPIDTVALEQVRAAQTAFMNEQSKRMSQAMVEAAQVLTPEQRKKLAAMMPQVH